MALKSTVFRCELQVNDFDRNTFGAHTLTLARHPSETDERMMVRLAAFAFHADESLSFGRGLSNDDEPALWRRDLTGAIEEWIEVGAPDARNLRRAAGRSQVVRVYGYGRAFNPWWSQNQADLARIERLAVYSLDNTAALGALADRGMRLQCMISDDVATFTDDSESIAVARTSLKEASAG